jgi:CheY-like chemotaxis protein
VCASIKLVSVLTAKAFSWNWASRQGQAAVQVVIIDLQGLENALALELVGLIHREPSFEMLPVIALTSRASNAAENKLQMAGFSNILYKPLRCITIAAVLLQALGMQGQTKLKKGNTNANAKILSGKLLLVVCPFIPGCFPTVG